MRIAPEELSDLYCCPRCKATLRNLVCTECQTKFQKLDNLPLLVDFGSSILDQNVTIGRAAVSPILRAKSRSRKRLHPQVESNLKVLSTLVEASSRVLIVGGAEDAHGLGEFISRGDISTIAFDIYGSELTDFIADAHSIPLRSDSIDCVVIQAVLEHVLDPWQVVSEIYRVLKTNGLVYAETPFMQQVHEGAYDFTRFTENGHRWLFRRFAVVDSGAIGGPILVLTWTTEYLLKALRLPTRLRNVIRRILSRFGGLDKFLNSSLHADSASAVYFLGRKADADSQMTPAEIVSFYSRQGWGVKPASYEF